MADITGKIYESFTEYILLRIGFIDYLSDGGKKKYLYEKHCPALCKDNIEVCPYSELCKQHSIDKNIPYGPWNDPDFFVVDEDTPIACFHVTHWSSPRNSPFKFWRTIEDHFQYKIFYGREFLSINLVYVALDKDVKPQLVFDSQELISLHGWSPANGSVLSVSFDASILFPQEYLPLEKFAEILTTPLPSNARAKRMLLNETWDKLYDSDKYVKSEIDCVVKLFKKALNNGPSPRYSQDVINHLQKVCWSGRSKIEVPNETRTSYRKGILHSFILREFIRYFLGNYVNPDVSLWKIAKNSPRFIWKNLPQILGLPNSLKVEDLEKIKSLLSITPVQMVNREPIPFMNSSSGLGHVEWNESLKSFFLGLKNLGDEEFDSFCKSANDLFVDYEKKAGMEFVLKDLCDPERISKKVNYVYKNYIGIDDKDLFISLFSRDMLTPNKKAPHKEVCDDIHNWPADIMLAFYDIGSMQHISTRLPLLFEASQGHSLRPYAFMNDLGKIVGHLIAGIPVGQFFSSNVLLKEETFYEVIWPLFSECVWDAMQGKRSLNPSVIEVNYRYKKAMRIISSPDLEPISALFQKSLPAIEDGPTLKGCFNQLSSLKNWSNSALTTSATGLEPLSGAIIQTQAVYGQSNNSHKTKELSGRQRSIHLKCNEAGLFEPNDFPGKHYLVIDGEWPIKSKINLYESGFDGIFEIGELVNLVDELSKIL